MLIMPFGLQKKRADAMQLRQQNELSQRGNTNRPVVVSAKPSNHEESEMQPHRCHSALKGVLQFLSIDWRSTMAIILKYSLVQN
jgi:hypothetical protein